MSPCKISGNMHLSLWSRLQCGVGQVHKNENFKKMKRTALWIAAISCIITMISCGSGKKALTSADIDGQWTIVEAMGQAVTGNEGNVPSINFNVAEKSVSGTTGCNRFMGGFTLGEKNAVSFCRKRMISGIEDRSTVISWIYVSEQVIFLFRQISNFRRKRIQTGMEKCMRCSGRLRTNLVC